VVLLQAARTLGCAPPHYDRLWSSVRGGQTAEANVGRAIGHALMGCGASAPVEPQPPDKDPVARKTARTSRYTGRSSAPSATKLAEDKWEEEMEMEEAREQKIIDQQKKGSIFRRPSLGIPLHRPSLHGMASGLGLDKLLMAESNVKRRSTSRSELSDRFSGRTSGRMSGRQSQRMTSVSEAFRTSTMSDTDFDVQ